MSASNVSENNASDPFHGDLGSHREAAHRVVLEPYTYIFETGGKRVRSVLIDAFQHWLCIDGKVLDVIKEVIEMLHTSSLLIDDIEDNSTHRRGVPVAHAIYGAPLTINSANYVYFLAMDKIKELGNVAALHCFIEEMLNLHRGQGLEIYWRDNIVCPTEEEYRGMVIDKTGGLFRLAVGLMLPFSERAAQKSQLLSLMDTLGMWYQIRDDLLSLTDDDHMKRKGFCEDISEGKFSFPILHAIRSQPDDHRLINILRQRTTDEDVKRHAVRFMQRTNSFDYTRQTLHTVEQSARRQMQQLGGNPTLCAIFDKLSLRKCTH